MIRLVRAGLALALLLATALPASAKLFEPESFTLANGLQVIVITDRRAPVVTHMVWYKVGSADEPAGKSGIAHFLEHLMFKGTPSVPPGEFSKTVARNGGRDNAFTARDYTGYFQTVARDRLELVMKLEADRMANLVLTEAEVVPERQVILEERASRTDNDPGALLGEQMAAAMFLNHPYGRPVIGWAHEIAALGVQDALDWYRAWYAPNNAILIVAGDIDVAALRPLAEKYYGAVARRDVPPRVRTQEPPARAARRVILEDARVRQPSVTRTYFAPSRNAGETRHAVPLSMLAEILNGATGRLHQKLVVNDGVAASAGAWYDSVSLDPSSFAVAASPRPGGSIEAVEAAVDVVLADLLAGGVTPAELERARTNLIADTIYARDSLGTGPRIFGSALTSGLSIEDVESWPDRVKAVTVEQVNEAARHVLDKRRSVTGILLNKPQA